MNLPKGRPIVPGKVTSGVCKTKCGWHYWTRVNGNTTWGRQRRTREESAADLVAALAGNPPPKRMRRPEGQRIKLGLCERCAAPRVPNRQKCDRHLRLDREKVARRNRAAGVRTREQYLRELAARRPVAAPPKPPAPSPPRCPCGLLLPCYHLTITDFAEMRPGAGD